MRQLISFLFLSGLIAASSVPVMAAGPNPTFTVQQKVGLRRLEMSAVPDVNKDKRMQPNELIATIPGKFAAIDANGDKSIDAKELARAMEVFRQRYASVYGNSIEPHVTRVENRYRLMDTDENGAVSYAEFATYFGTRYGQFDQNHDGVITAEEYRVDAEKLEIGF